MRGPIDFIIVKFEGNNFSGEILKELQKASKSGTIDVLAALAVVKDKDGVVSTLNFTDNDTLEIVTTLKLDNSLVTDDDVNEVGDLLENNSAAGLLVIEHLWAKGLKQAIVNANGELIADGRIHPEASEELSKEGK